VGEMSFLIERYDERGGFDVYDWGRDDSRMPMFLLSGLGPRGPRVVCGKRVFRPMGRPLG
jgi:hypothetical protein